MSAHRIQHQASVLWSSFMVAAVAELLVFGLVDPIVLLQIDDGLQTSRTQIYSFGFLFFWAVGIISSETSALLHQSVRFEKTTSSSKSLNRQSVISPRTDATMNA